MAHIINKEYNSEHTVETSDHVQLSDGYFYFSQAGVGVVYIARALDVFTITRTDGGQS